MKSKKFFLFVSSLFHSKQLYSYIEYSTHKTQKQNSSSSEHLHLKYYWQHHHMRWAHVGGAAVWVSYDLALELGLTWPKMDITIYHPNWIL